MKIKTILLMTVAFYLTVTPAVMAADTAEDFVAKASVSNLFEIESSKLALEKSQNTAVKKFAQQMIDDHTKAGQDLEATLPKSGVESSFAKKTLDDKHSRIMKDLRDENGSDFDEDYVDAQVKAHNEAVNLFSDYSAAGDNGALKDFATKTLPTLKAHQQHVQALDKQVD